jgi:hypothetical protein
VLGTTIAATAFERLGRCPLQFFFRDVCASKRRRRRKLT